MDLKLWAVGIGFTSKLNPTHSPTGPGGPPGAKLDVHSVSGYAKIAIGGEILQAEVDTSG